MKKHLMNIMIVITTFTAQPRAGGVFPLQREKEQSGFCRKTLLYLHF